MNKSEARWAVFLVILMVLAYVVPYTLLTNVDAWYGSFLFWSIFGLVIIVANVFITIKWSD